MGSSKQNYDTENLKSFNEKNKSSDIFLVNLT